MKKEVSLDSQGGQSSGGSLGNSRLTLASKDTIVTSKSALDLGLVDVSVQVDLPVDVIIYDSDDDTMGRKRFSAFRTKKGTPLYSKEDIREQYCITNKQLHVLETAAQDSKIFGCIPNQDWKSCHRASLLSSCLRKTKSASDENLAGIRMDAKPLAWEPLPPEMQGPSPKVLLSAVTNQGLRDSREDAVGQQRHFQLQPPQASKSLRQSFDEELANAVLRRKVRLDTDDGGVDSESGFGEPKRHTWGEECRKCIGGDGAEVPSSSSDGNLLAHQSSRPTLLRLRSQDSGSVTSDAISVDSQEGAKRHAKTMPNTPDLSHGGGRRQAKTPELTLDERRQKHVSFDSAALIRSHPAISSIDDGQQLASPPARRSAKASPDRKSQERLLDIGSSSSSSKKWLEQQQLGRRLGSLRSLDFLSSLAPNVNPTLLLTKLRKSMKTQATQTEITVAERIAIPAPVLAYLTLSPRAHSQDPPAQGRVCHNGKRLVKSRSDSEYKMMACDDAERMKMTVIHLDDSAVVAKRHASRSKSTPIGRASNKNQKEIMVMFKPQDRKGNGGSRYTTPHHHKLLKTYSEGSVLNRQRQDGVVGDESPEPEVSHDGVGGGDDDRQQRERSESDPMLLETDMDERSAMVRGHEPNGEGRQRSRSVAQTESEKQELLLMNNRELDAMRRSSESSTASDEEQEEQRREDEAEVEDEVVQQISAVPKAMHAEVAEKISGESPRSEGGSQYHSLTDHSASSTPTIWSSRSRKEESLAEREVEKLGHDNVKKSKSDGTGSLDSDRLASCKMDKTIACSSDTEFGSIKSESSHTLMDQGELVDDKEATTPSDTLPKEDIRVKQPAPEGRAPLTATPPRESSEKLKSPPRFEMRFLSPKEHLTSPESESSSSHFTERESSRSELSLGPGSVTRPKSNLSYTDSNKSEPEGSETSEDYHTATEHSAADAFETWAGIKSLSGAATARGPSRRSSDGLTLTNRTSLTISCNDDVPDDFTDVSLVTEVAAPQDGVTSGYHNLASPRSPHTHGSSLSIESSTSGSYTLESGLSEHDSKESTRKLSTSTVSDSDKELENIFGAQCTGLVSEQRDNGQGRIERNLEQDEEEDEHSVTPTPGDIPYRGSVKRAQRAQERTRSIEDAVPAASKTDSGIEEMDKRASEESTGRPTEVVESMYNFAEIRQKFEKMLESKKQEDSRDRSSSVETECTSSLSDSKPPIRKKPDILTAKPTLYSDASKTPARPSGFGQKLEREGFAKKTPQEDDKSSPSSDMSKDQKPVASNSCSDCHRKEYRRSVSESPEASGRPLVAEIPRSISDANVEGSFVGGGAKSKRGFSDGQERLRNGKKHKSRSVGKDGSGQSKHKDHKDHKDHHQMAGEDAVTVDSKRSISESPQRWMGRGGPTSRSSSRDDMSENSATSSRVTHKDHREHHRAASEDPEASESRRSISESPQRWMGRGGASRSSSRDDMSENSASSSKVGHRRGHHKDQEPARERKRSSSRTPERELDDRGGPDAKKHSCRTTAGEAAAAATLDKRHDKRRPLSSFSFDASDLLDDGRFKHRKRRERSLPGSTEKLIDKKGEEMLSKSLPDRQMEFYEMSKMLCSECGEKVRKIHGDEAAEVCRLSHGRTSASEPRMQEATWIGATKEHRHHHHHHHHCHLTSVPKRIFSRDRETDAESAVAGSGQEGELLTKNYSGQSSTESLLRRSPGGASSAVDSPGPSSSQTSSSWAECSQFPSSQDIGQEEEDEDVGVYAESYRASAWIYIGDNEELMVWQGRPGSSGNDKFDEDTKMSGASGPSGASPSPLPVSVSSADPTSLHRTDSLESTASEKEFRRRYQAITHRMVHRKSSVEMYKRLSNRTFECDKTVMVLRKSGEFGFRIHGSRPVVVSAIEPGTPAESSGLEVGDIVIAVNGVNVLDASHSEVVKIAHKGSDTLRLDVARTCHILTPVVSDLECQRPVHSGFLYKLTGGGAALVKKWCKRYFVLKQDHCLYYYKTDVSKEPLGAVMLLNYSVSRAVDAGRSFAFRLTKFGSASYCFSAEDEQAMNDWASALNQACNSACQSDPWIEVSSRNVQLPALSIHSPDCHGYLAKLGQRWRSWKRRYCVLKDACIYLYHDMNSTTSLGVAHLHGYRVQSCSVAGKKHAFEAIPPELKMRHFHFYADNDTDRKRWLAALEYSIDRWIKVG